MIITKTPFRMSFVGGGSDIGSFYRLEKGAVLSTSIDKYMYLTVHKRFDDSIRVCYSVTEEVNKVSQIKHPLVRETLKLLSIEGGVEISSNADVPGKGTGLGSSSSYTVGLLNALYSYKGEQISKEKLAIQACEVEIEKCGEPIGKQDQYAASYGGLKLYEFMPNDEVNVVPVESTKDFLKLFSDSILVFYTGETRSARGILSEQTKLSSRKDKRLVLRRMAEFAYQFKDEIEKENLTNLGGLLKENWNLKKSLTNRISNNTIEEIYSLGLENGAMGGKLLGAGQAGFIMFLAHKKHHKNITKALNKLRKVDFGINSKGTEVIYSD